MSLFSNLELMLYRASLFEGLWQSTSIVVADADGGEVLAASPSFLAMFGYTADDLDGETIDRFVPEALRDRHRQHRATFAAAPRIRPMGAPGMDLLGQRKDGSTFPVAIQLSPTTIDDDRAVVIGIVVDLGGRAA